MEELLGRAKHARRGTAVSGYRNGYGPPRQLALLNGTVTVRRPRVRNLDARFVSRVLPLFQRRTPEVAKLLPELLLYSLSSGDFTLALRGLLGDGAPLSASRVHRLTEDWPRDYAQWRTRDLSALEPVYMWADGIYVKAGLESTKAALLVLIAALADRTKVVLAVESGHRESSESWAEILRDLTARGLPAPACVIGDGALRLWNAVGQVWPPAAEQRCWNHTLGNTYYQFPKAHWRHPRTTNVVGSPFAAVRLRTSAAKRFKKVERATAIIWRLLRVAEKRFRKLNAPEQCREVFRGVRYADGIEIPAVSPTQKAAA